MSDQPITSRGRIAREYLRVGESLPVPTKVDWANVPSKFKVYRSCPKVNLDNWTCGKAGAREVTNAQSPFEHIGRFLRDVNGLTRQRWTAPRRFAAASNGVAPPRWYQSSHLLRPVPAGGALFPCELYLLARQGQSIPIGVYHYDPAHHVLDTIRDGDHCSMLTTYLGRKSTNAVGLSLLITIAFWKNVFKYGEFSYRLHSLDAGVVIGQSLTIAARYNLRPTVHWHFPDAELDHLLGLDPAYESVYAVLTLANAVTADLDPALANTSNLADQQAPTPPRVAAHPAAEQRKSIGSYRLPARLHRAAMTQAGERWPMGDSLPPVLADAPASRHSLPLPTASLDLLEGLHRRRSSMGYFSPAPLACHQLAKVLASSMQGYSSDLGDSQSIRHTTLFCAVNHVEDVDPGVYYYDPARHTLEQVYEGDVRAELQAALSIQMFDMFQVGLCLIPVANYERRLPIYGDRWYRVQNMEAGIIVQRLYLAAAALGLGCHTHLSFRVDAVNALLGLQGSPLTSLIQVLIGPERRPGDCYEHRI
jgi:SagB-type dehydrogenase family enzyme